MRRFLSFRDFDWGLLFIVLVMCTVSVLEIYSATLHTKYIGFHTKQIYWIAGGMAAMFLLAKVDYHRLLDFSRRMRAECRQRPAPATIEPWRSTCSVRHRVKGPRTFAEHNFY